MLKAGKYRVRLPMNSMNLINLPTCITIRIMALGLTQATNRNFPWGKARPARKSDNLNAICGTLDASHPYGP
jgi:hypothetical protein